MRGEEVGRVARQHLRPAMRQLAFLERRRVAAHRPRAARATKSSCSNRAATMAPSTPQLPPRARCVRRQGQWAARLGSGMLFSFPPAKKAIRSPSGEKRLVRAFRAVERHGILAGRLRRVASIDWPSRPVVVMTSRVPSGEETPAGRARAPEPHPGHRGLGGRAANGQASAAGGQSTGQSRPRPARQPSPREPMPSMTLLPPVDRSRRR